MQCQCRKQAERSHLNPECNVFVWHMCRNVQQLYSGEQQSSMRWLCIHRKSKHPHFRNRRVSCQSKMLIELHYDKIRSHLLSSVHLVFYLIAPNFFKFYNLHLDSQFSRNVYSDLLENITFIVNIHLFIIMYIVVIPACLNAFR